MDENGGRGLSMEENWPAGDKIVVNPHMSVGHIPLHDLTTIIIVASKTFKTHIFKNVLLFTRRPHGRIIMNLFRKLKFSCTCSNSTSLPTPHPWNNARVKPPSVQTFPANALYAQQFLPVNVSNEWKTEKRHECTNMGKVERIELWWQLYLTSLTERDVRNIRPLEFCWTECT